MMLCRSKIFTEKDTYTCDLQDGHRGEHKTAIKSQRGDPLAIACIDDDDPPRDWQCLQCGNTIYYQRDPGICARCSGTYSPLEDCEDEVVLCRSCGSPFLPPYGEVGDAAQDYCCECYSTLYNSLCPHDLDDEDSCIEDKIVRKF
jgi:hypothetical protein